MPKVPDDADELLHRASQRYVRALQALKEILTSLPGGPREGGI
jgi:hypothetical protein